MNRLQKFVEKGVKGEGVGRHAYVLQSSALPAPSDGMKWYQVEKFSAATARTYHVSATGRKVWNIGSTVMLVGLAIWLFTSRDQEGRLSENFLLAIIMVFVVRYLFRLSIVALFPPIETPK
jgi:hypothetical protein